MNYIKILLITGFSVFSFQPKENIYNIVKRFSKTASNAYLSRNNANITSSITNYPEKYGIRIYENKNENEKELIIVLRGSKSFSDWINNFNCFLTEYPYEKNIGKIHSGYLKKANKIIKMPQFEKVKDYLSKNDNITVYFTAHSSGCKSIIIATYLSNLYPKHNFITICFGSPNFCNAQFYNTLKERENIYTISVKFIDDIIGYSGIGVNKSKKKIDIIPAKNSFNLFENHLMIRYEKYCKLFC